MTNRTTNKFAPEVRSRAVRMVFEHEGDHDSRWSTIASIAAKIGCTPETLRLWVKRAEREGGKIDGAAPDLNAQDCQEFRVWAGMMEKKEISHGPTQRAPHP